MALYIDLLSIVLSLIGILSSIPLSPFLKRFRISWLGFWVEKLVEIESLKNLSCLDLLCLIFHSILLALPILLVWTYAISHFAVSHLKLGMIEHELIHVQFLLILTQILSAQLQSSVQTLQVIQVASFSGTLLINFSLDVGLSTHTRPHIDNVLKLLTVMSLV